MELALSLGDASKPFSFLEKPQNMADKDLGFCMGLGPGANERRRQNENFEGERDEDERRVSSDPPVQLDLLPFSPVPRNPPPSQLSFPWLPDHNLAPEAGSSDGPARGVDVNRPPAAGDEADDGGTALSSPNSTVSSFQMDFSSIYRSGSGRRSKRDLEAAGINEIDAERASSRASDDDENGLTRKKLRLSKEQSAFLEESFKEHHTLNPKQKLALAKQLNLRPRQVEVWFQNRRARTKLKQTEVDCEYLKRCCETLTEENRRLQKELQELRALKTSQPFYMQLPATTLTMCPSCERVATTTAAPSTSAGAANSTPLPVSKPRFYPFSHSQNHAQQVHAHPAAS
ncbi:homeobox-leucine zipper protein HOX11 [Malania oleifera]|uniref:homeobox-leucine zipper protein HOX11 n=1 Tax=Malania oleifera TaxID=397392 RepID=UPI0025AE792E|nr:homeobox-leucine zipper protein HOX11 [Malania oleifera]